jgi:hypothetical protein
MSVASNQMSLISEEVSYMSSPKRGGSADQARHCGSDSKETNTSSEKAQKKQAVKMRTYMEELIPEYVHKGKLLVKNPGSFSGCFNVNSKNKNISLSK